MIPGVGAGSPAGSEEGELSGPLRSMTVGDGGAAGELKNPVGWTREGGVAVLSGVVPDGVEEERSPERVEDGLAGELESTPSGGGGV